MKSNNPKIWKEIAVTWMDDFHASVICPNCKSSVLAVKDSPTNQANVIDRYVECPNCGITETFTMPTPDYALNDPKILETLRRLPTKEIQDGAANLKGGLKLVYEAILKERGIK